MKDTNHPNSQIEPGKSTDLGAREGRPAAGAPLTAEAGPVASNVAGLKPPGSRKPRKSVHAAEPRGGLDREILARIGKGLKESFEDVRRQEVPERFKVLLQRLR